MPLWRKCVLGPDTPIACAACGRAVGVPWIAVAAAIPIALGIVAAVRWPLPWSVAGLVAGLMLYVAIQRYAVPLVGRDA
jgi:hypothetical protein